MAKQSTRRTRRRAGSDATRAGLAAAGSSAPQTAFGMPNVEIERALLTGEQRGPLEDYFGPDAYGEIRDLARDANTRAVRGGARVIILPGIMGSTLARRGLAGFDHVLWIDPVEIAAGRLTELKLGGAATPYHAAGVVLLAYLKLKLRLNLAGFDADFFPYDWRRSLADVGAALADRIRQDAAAQVRLVAHSMGGLVARAALAVSAAAAKKVSRLIMLGAPNYGSFAPVQVVRGTYDVVQKVAALDLEHDADELSGQVFNTFPGLYEMLPAPEKFAAVDLYDPAAWPAKGPRPRPTLLAAVKPVINRLAPADSRFFLVAGVNRETVVGLHTSEGEFAYDVSPDGDGTVPLAFARLANIDDKQTYYVEESHGSLPNNGLVESAVIDLLATGATTALPTVRPPARGAARVVSERQMVAAAEEGQHLGTADHRGLLDAVAAAPRRGQPGVAAAGGPAGPAAGGVDLSKPYRNVIIGRRRQRRIEITVALGSISDVDSPAYVLGMFRDVAPSGAARAVDQRLGGAINEFTGRRMFNGDLGAIFTVPVGHNQLPADVVLLAGLGPFDRFTGDTQQLVAENIVRVLVRSRVDEFATVLIGAGSGQSATTVVQNLLGGFLRGLNDVDPRMHFRGITLCETDATRFAEMKTEVYRLAGSPLFDDVELTLNEAEIAPTARPVARAVSAGPEPVYAIVRQEGQTKDRIEFRTSVLGSGMKAAIVTSRQDVDKGKLAGLFDELNKTVGPSGNTKGLSAIGQEFARTMLPQDVRSVLLSLKDRHIVIVHDVESSRIPWETIRLDKWVPAAENGLSRRYLAANLPIATWLETRRAQPTLKLLLVVNPLGDLDGADKEGERILALAKRTAGIEVESLPREKASKAAVLSALRSGRFDFVHYAGHAFFDPNGPSRSGLVCTHREVLSGADLTGVSNLPFVIFFNACEAGRLRTAPQPSRGAATLVRESGGVAEALMRGGVANFLSTYWPVGDDSAETFSETFYTDVLAGKTLGEAVLHGRRNILTSKDWSNYILYGSYDFVLKPKP
jgi:pimeloyl-ACP methyl ester carboxylesterase